MGRSASITAANPPPLPGPVFPISFEPIDEHLPAVAYNPEHREYLVVWQNYWPSGHIDIYAQRITEQGQKKSWFWVANGQNPSVAYNPKNNTFLVAYDVYAGADYDIYAQRVDITGPLGAPIPIAFNLKETEHTPTVAANLHPNHDEFLVVWENISPPPTAINNIEGQRVAGSPGGGTGGGETIGSRIAITSNNHYDQEPDVAYNLNRNEFLVVYTRQPSGGGTLDIFGRRVTGNGTPLAEESIDSSGGNQANPAVAAYSQDQATPYLVVFTDFWNDAAGDVRGYLVDADGKPVDLVHIAVTQGQRELTPAIAGHEAWGGYFVTWTQGPVADLDIFGRRVRHNGNKYPPFDISGTSGTSIACNRNYSGVAVGGSSALTVWMDPCSFHGGYDILGRMLGYQTRLPITIR